MNGFKCCHGSSVFYLDLLHSINNSLLIFRSFSFSFHFQSQCFSVFSTCRVKKFVSLRFQLKAKNNRNRRRCKQKREGTSSVPLIKWIKRVKRIGSKLQIPHSKRSFCVSWKMTNKLELDFGEGNYQGSKMFSSLAEVMGLSVDLVSRASDCGELSRHGMFLSALTPTYKKCPSHIAV